MTANRNQSDIRIVQPPRAWKQAAIAMVTLLMSRGVALGQQVDPEDSIERAMYFVSRSAEATGMFNSNKPQEALMIFQELAAGYADLDENGYVATAVGDCLAALERDDEALAAYGAAAATHPELEDAVRQKIIELELAGRVTGELIDELRGAADEADDDTWLAANWRLGRALQKRASALLDEAAVVFRTAADAGGSEIYLHRTTILHQATLLEELAEDLTSLIERLESRWGPARGPVVPPGCPEAQVSPSEIVTESQRCQRRIRTKDGRRIELRLETGGEEPNAETKITVNGRPVTLTAAQKQIIQRHQYRINAILLEAAGQAEPPDRPEH